MSSACAPASQQLCSLDKVKYNGGGRGEIMCYSNIPKLWNIFLSKYEKELTFIKCSAFAKDYSMYFICIIILNSQNNLYGRYYRNTQFTYKKTKEKKAQNY